VVINNFNITGVTISPNKTHAPLVINANAVLPFPITAQSFKPVIGRYTQIIKPSSPVQHLNLALSHCPDVDEPCNRLTCKQGLGICALERLNHGDDYLTPVVKRQALFFSHYLFLS